LRDYITEPEEHLSDSPPRKEQGQSRGESRPSFAPRGLRRKFAYGLKIFPSFVWQRFARRLPRGRTHLMLALADHFEPAIVPGDGQARAPYAEQERRLERWCREYPIIVGPWRDRDGRAFIHTYFYPAEQYDRGLVGRLAEHCAEGWGEIEVHLHHGIPNPDTAENTTRTLVTFRDALALEHGCLSYADGTGQPRYVFVHGNFALANSANGFGCGVDEELQILADTGCYADMTLPASPFHPSQCAKINSLYECEPPLKERAAYRRGQDLISGRTPDKFPLIVQGPLTLDFSAPGARRLRIDNGAFSGSNPPTIERWQLWKRAAVSVKGKPNWLFLKLHCHGMDPTQRDAVAGDAFRNFLRSLVEGADERNEVLHFVSAREMVNIILAACDGREGDPGDYREYRFKRRKGANSEATIPAASQAALRG